MTAVSQMLRPNDRFITNLRMERCVGVIKISRPYGWGLVHTARTDGDGGSYRPYGCGWGSHRPYGWGLIPMAGHRWGNNRIKMIRFA